MICRRVAGKLFHTHGPATVKLLSPQVVRVHGDVGEILSEPCYDVVTWVWQNFPSDIAKIKSNVGGTLMVYELPLVASMSATVDERSASQASTPLHQCHHGNQQLPQPQQWGLGQIQRRLTSEYCWRLSQSSFSLKTDS